MATGQAIHDALPLPAGITSTTKSLTAINWAISGAWPSIKRIKKEAAAFTFVAGQTSYSLSGISDLTEWGVSQVIVQPNDETIIKLRQWRQIYTGSTWELHFPAGTVSDFAGEAADLLYEVRLQPISSLSDETYLPLEWGVYKVSEWYALRAMAELPSSTANEWGVLARHFAELAEAKRKQHLTLPLTRTGNRLKETP